MLLRYLSSSTATSCLVVQLRKISSASSTLLRSQSSFSLFRHGHAPNNIHYTAANNNRNRHLFHNSAIRLASNDNNDVYVSLETASSSSSSKSNNIDSSNNSSSDSSCSQGISLDENDNDEEEQEEMFVVADPILGHGTRKEWGGPRRGGSLAEPTRFGDWERKGRCTDF